MGLKITHIAFKNYRSYDTFDLDDIGALTILVGPNAVGKTNIVEGIQLLTALQSFRHPALDQITRHGSDFTRLDADVSDEKRQLSLSLRIGGGKKQYLLNGKSKSASELKGLIPSVTFTPDDLQLIKGSSSARRATLDILGSQLSANHYVIKKDYEKILRYKNRLLKDDAPSALLESINETLVMCGAQLSCYRSALFEKIAPLVQSYYASIADRRETLEMCYIPSWEQYDQNVCASFAFSRDEAREYLQRGLRVRADEERGRKRALSGPHADHMEFFLSGRNAGLYGSQGQQRSIVLAWKLAEVELIQALLHQKPVLLLDDVMSELDISRRNALISFIEGDIQTFITTTNLTYFDKSVLARAQIVDLSPKSEDLL